jgi:hypothetical protein
MADQTRYDLLKFSYGEVLDATKHQDDKIGRILTAVAFLTGGALVFANKSILGGIYQVGDHAYHLTALFLGVFLFFDLLAVMLFILAVATPLTYPGLVSGTGSNRSRLFYRVIGKTPWKDYEALWAQKDAESKDDMDQRLTEAVSSDLVAESYNIARRVLRKNDRSRDAAAFFLFALIFLVPTIVLSIDAVSRGTGSARHPLHWDLNRRLWIGAPVALFVLVLVLWAWDQARASTASSSRAPYLLAVAFAHPVFVGMCVASHNGSFAAPVAVLGLVVTFSLWKVLDPEVQNAKIGDRLVQLGGVSVALTLTAAGVVVVATRASDLQLLIGMVAACIVLVTNFQPTPLPTPPALPLASPGPSTPATP